MSYAVKYQCNRCKEIHDTSSAAEWCCDPEEVYVCDGCQKQYTDEDLAEECCAEQEDSRESVETN